MCKPCFRHVSQMLVLHRKNFFPQFCAGLKWIVSVLVPFQFTHTHSIKEFSLDILTRSNTLKCFLFYCSYQKFSSSLLNNHVNIRQGLFFYTYHYIDSSFILGKNLLIVKEITCSSKGIFHSIYPRDVRSNTHNVHSLVIPSAALQLNRRLSPHEGI